MATIDLAKRRRWPVCVAVGAACTPLQCETLNLHSIAVSAIALAGITPAKYFDVAVTLRELPVSRLAPVGRRRLSASASIAGIKRWITASLASMTISSSTVTCGFGVGDRVFGPAAHAARRSRCQGSVNQDGKEPGWVDGGRA